jgi:serine palmitoyltransferase
MPSSPLPSPMAINKPHSTSMFKKRSAAALAPMASAASYLSALSQADARARTGGRSPPTSTPALSLSSSVTSSSEDTILHEYEYEGNADGLALPSTPPTSEQVFTTVHTEFGHCANEDFRTVSHHVPGTSVPAHVDQDPPYYILFSTYISYLILICLGHVRDFVGKRLSPSSYKHLIPRDVSPFISAVSKFFCPKGRVLLHLSYIFRLFTLFTHLSLITGLCTSQFGFRLLLYP